MANRLQEQNYDVRNELIFKDPTFSYEEELITVKSGEGTIEAGQVLGIEYATGKYKKYDSGASDGSEEPNRIAIDSGDATSGDIKIMALKVGKAIKEKLVGIDVVLTTGQISTPSAPTTALAVAGTLVAGTTYDYKYEGTNNDGHSIQGAESGKTASNATAGTLSSQYTYSAIANINSALGDCSVTPKNVNVVVDGTLFTIAFNLDYTGAGAFADFTAFETFVDSVFTGSEATSSVSTGTAIVLTSATTGASSTVAITSDASGLFGTPVVVDGEDAKKTINVGFEKPAGATGVKIWRTADGGTTWGYYVPTASELSAKVVVDNGSVTFTAGTPVSANDFTAIAKLERNAIYPISQTNSYVQEYND